ncbi:MAG: hypothetical protein M3335_07275 [Actinomycetota bacterium]|nr:hypothetical protein [Actinomycetota bacterium]
MKRGRGLAILGTLLAAGALVWLIAFSGDDGPGTPPFTASDSLVRAECLMGTYLPEAVGTRAENRPPPRDWSRIEEAPRALQPDRAAVAVTLRPKRPGEAITLTGIHLDVVQHRLRPLGAVFYRPCKRQLRGPAIEADLDGEGELTSSSAALDGAIGPGLQLPDSAQPIEFPWTVRLSKPLRLYLVTHTEHCYCSWSARIPWESEQSNGVIRVDNGGEKYTMTDTIGVFWNRPGAGGRWVQGLAPRWTGVR